MTSALAPRPEPAAPPTAAARAAADARAWIGRSETRAGALSPELAAMLACALGHPAAPPPDTGAGGPMPALWHWAAFPDFVPMAGLGPDGHPARGGFLPALPFERRMWAGGRLAFHGRLAIGEPLTRRSEILDVSYKAGATGEMAFVRVGHRIEGAGGGRVDEEQDLVYLPIPESFRPPRPTPAPPAPVLDEGVEVGPVRLFRFSAATWNGHRIHYDRDYATGTEKYPGLVVHGPLQAMLLIEAGQRQAGRRPARFAFRGVHPLFTGVLRLQAVPDGAAALALCTVAPEGHQGMQARLEWEE